MAVPKTAALPLGDAPTEALFSEGVWGVQEAFCENLHAVVRDYVGRLGERMEQVDVIVLGAGAAGMLAAIEAELGGSSLSTQAEAENEDVA